MKTFPRAREVDESGEELLEEQRQCRLLNDINGLKIFNKYSKEACLFECKVEIAMDRCDCLPWDYPPNLLVCNLETFLMQTNSWEASTTILLNDF